MTGRALAVLETELKRLGPTFQSLLGPCNMDAERFARTVLIAQEKTPSLLECDLQSLVSAAMTGAVIGLEPDGALGQAYLIPFKVKGRPRAQFITGYQGYNTIAARSGFAILGEAVYEGDEFEVQLGSVPMVHHKIGSRKEGGKLLKVWAQGRRNDGLLTTPVVLSINDINAVMAKAPGAKYGDSPWKDPRIGFPAMATKTAKRRLKRSLPLVATPGLPYSQFHLAAMVDERHEEMGQHINLTPEGSAVIDGTAETPTQPPPDQPPVQLEKKIFPIHGRNEAILWMDTLDLWHAEMDRLIAKCPHAAAVTMLKELNYEAMHDDAIFPGRLISQIMASFDNRIAQFLNG